jgi:hypothetical protein
MTELLKKAFEAASQLPPGEQDALASVLLGEIEGEHRWDATLEETHEKLIGLADAALAEHRAGKTQPLDSDEL